VAAVEVEAWDTMPGIVWGESIEGVRIGDSMETVVSKLGPPEQYGQGDGDVMYLIYHRGLIVSIYQPLDITSSIKLLLFGKGGYEGTTNEGIGMGTHRDETLRKLGIPNKTIESNGDIDDFYVISDFTSIWIDYKKYPQGIIDCMILAMGTP
jgi:hypothetical protein